MSIAEQARAAGIRPGVVYQRTLRGWSLDEALTVPQRQIKLKAYTKKARDAGVYRSTVLRRIDMGLSMSEALANPKVCEACGHPSKRIICADHDYITGMFRGFLCHECNMSLGILHDDPTRLRALADYLERSRASL